jgi:hypothetical protein
VILATIKTQKTSSLTMKASKNFSARFQLETDSLLAKGYEENAKEALTIAKDFEATENKLDENCYRSD